MTGSVVNIRYGVVIIAGEDALQYYYLPDRLSDDLSVEGFTIGDQVTLTPHAGRVAKDVVVTRRAVVPESDGFA